MELFHASNQWATRPADERFSTLEEMYRATKRYADSARGATVDWRDLRVESRGDDLGLVGKAGVPARITNYAFGQLASRVGAPAGYLRSLSGTIAAQNLNFGLANREETGTKASLLFHENGSLLLRAAVSTRYQRIWNYEVIARLMGLCDRHGLVPAHKTFDWGDRDTEIDGSDPDLDRALYASDHDMFAFVMSPDRVVVDPVGQPLRRGIIVQNSEVGDKKFEFLGFFFREVCANHIIWGAERLAEVSFRHVGDVDEKLRDAVVEVRRYLDGAASIEEAKFEGFRKRIGETKEEVLDALFGKRSVGIPKKTLDAAYDAVVPDEDGDPRSVWGMTQGLTRVSQETEFAEDRVALDRAAGKLLSIDF